MSPHSRQTFNVNTERKRITASEKTVAQSSAPVGGVRRLVVGPILRNALLDGFVGMKITVWGPTYTWVCQSLLCL